MKTKQEQIDEMAVIGCVRNPQAHTTKLGQVLLSIDTVKEMNAMCNIDEQVKQAKIDVLNELKKKKSIAIWDIDEIIEELKK